MSTVLDQYVARLQNVRPFNVYTIDGKGAVAPWYEVGPEIVRELVLSPHNLDLQVQAISAQIQFWGRMEAQAKRVWEIEERRYRQWRDSRLLELSQPPSDPEAAKGWKKPTEKSIEATYRSESAYRKFWMSVERAEEAFNACHSILEGFRAKKDMLRSHVYRSQEDGAARLSV
jgi:hypothetical protein